MPLPQDILESAGRVWEYHLSTKLTEASPAPRLVRPAVRVFDYLPKTALSPKLVDLPTATLTVLTRGVDALPESMQLPPQDLRTLSTWLYMAAGQRPGPPELPRAGEIYVAAFAIDGLEPGLYHFAPAEFALRQLRDGVETMALLRRGRPDLNFLTTAPAALLVSTVFARANALFGRRGYRSAVLDAGHLVADCVAAATGLGMRTMTRLKMTESSMRELIGLPEDFDDSSAESVQAMVAWTDTATTPMTAAPAAAGPLMTLPRTPVGPVPPQPAVLAVHRDVTMRGLPARELRSPMTELSPVGVNMASEPMPCRGDPPSRPLREVLTSIRPADGFHKKTIGRDALCQISSVGFRSGTFFPLKPDGPHAALVRPLWVTSEAVGHDPGLWYHDPVYDGWAYLENGDFRTTVGPLTRGREGLEHASAVCAIVANLRKLLLDAGPDAYRLAHLEAGLAARRMHLTAASMGYVGRVFGDFYDDPWRQFLHLANTGWEVLAVFALGGPPPVRPQASTPQQAATPERKAGIIGFRD
ncbi:MAG TPA: nitroreductase family protein [Tepidisphaeraceae bacterium]|jgi:SagB-type dehydrogenase family enzyme